ncbi:unnamed protein product, partial [Cuscuta campestris]
IDDIDGLGIVFHFLDVLCIILVLGLRNVGFPDLLHWHVFTILDNSPKEKIGGLDVNPHPLLPIGVVLKDGLSGNSQTIMIATISPVDNQYHHTVNTLKYAHRAKEIKTHIQENVGTLNTNVSDYQRMIDSLQ